MDPRNIRKALMKVGMIVKQYDRRIKIMEMVGLSALAEPSSRGKPLSKIHTLIVNLLTPVLW
jgi:hypothetical protein